MLAKLRLVVSFGWRTVGGLRVRVAGAVDGAVWASAIFQDVGTSNMRA